MEFEQKLKTLEQLVEKLSQGKLSLEEDIKAFEKGIKLTRELNRELNRTEAKVKQLLKINEDGQVETKDFEPE